MATGRIAHFDPQTGTGWILPDAGGPLLAMRRSELQDATIDDLAVGDHVQYQVIRGWHGQPTAVHIHRLSTASPD